jgi:hypothetical protein
MPYIIDRLRVVILDMLLTMGNQVAHHPMNHAPDHLINKNLPVTGLAKTLDLLRTSAKQAITWQGIDR